MTKNWNHSFIEISEELKNEGYAREFVKQIQTYRKENQFEVLDNIRIVVDANAEVTSALKAFEEYICNETLCKEMRFEEGISDAVEIDLDEVKAKVQINKV